MGWTIRGRSGIGRILRKKISMKLRGLSSYLKVRSMYGKMIATVHSPENVP